MLAALLPLMAAIPISGVRSAWDVCATFYLLLIIAQWRGDVASMKPWAWLSCTAVAGLALSALASGQQVTVMSGRLISIGSMVGTLIFILRLYRRKSSYGLLAAACLAIGVNFQAVLPAAGGSSNPWKYGVGFGVAIVLLALAATTRKASLELSALAILAVISLATGTRGLTVTLVITSVLVISRELARQRSFAVRITATMVIAVAAVTAALTLGGPLVNSNFADSARDRFLQQAAINANPILAGRIEPPISISAVVTHPVIGAGANPEPTSEIVSRALHIADLLGYSNPDALVLWWTQENQIYTHSLLMDYWVVGGVLAALPFIAALGVLGLGLVRSLRRWNTVPALAIFLAAQSFSDLLFAPETFGSTAMVGLSVGLVLATVLAPRDAEALRSGEVEEPSHPRPQLGVA